MAESDKQINELCNRWRAFLRRTSRASDGEIEASVREWKAKLIKERGQECSNQTSKQ